MIFLTKGIGGKAMAKPISLEKWRNLRWIFADQEPSKTDNAVQ
jgi:hypothetical protein